MRESKRGCPEQPTPESLKAWNLSSAHVGTVASGAEDFTNLYVKCFPSSWDEDSYQPHRVHECFAEVVAGSCAM